ncbi:tRNA uracil 4-sulfurtransferase ThiI [Isachenkonia alkalipeptolytica]|uniref:Probable tRNA sulfurtransferase n=1 Tax=Isachenkonia alkalipeptolytica TaxID=2565777 RepID=A0AA43XLF1_9CLOT|nr:tRNA uracil 4-sulfurtransferase ThiI [Isachenkonia alkalipeptolytica]NBG88975.1 tRNA 4-thiouridine(8) synthase ThiI [Isachenkonia alkalipeptolytica]
MENVIIVRFGEINLKGKNKGFFESKLIKHIKNNIRGIENVTVYQEYSRVYIKSKKEDQGEIIDKVRKVFGIVSLSTAKCIESDLARIKETALKELKERIDQERIHSFKVVTKRANKKFPLNSMEVSSSLGEYLLDQLGDKVHVDVHNPDAVIKVEIRNRTYISSDHYPAYGGLPLETNGSALLMLSGGIDSPVAGWIMAKRGVKVHGVHFHSYPFTSERAQEKIMDLAKELSMYIGEFKIFSVNLLNIQKSISKYCQEEEMTIISRRFMTRIAQEIAKQHHFDALITGDNIGQVASQTMESLRVVTEVTEIPIFRPLIAFDKEDIVKISKDINTYEISIQPFEDCCSVFLPKRPLIKPRIDFIKASETNLDIDGLINEALENMEEEIITFELE